MGLAVRKIETIIDLDAVLGTAKKTETKGKSTVPVIKVEEKVMQDVDKIRELKEQLDSTQTMLDLMFAELQDAVRGGQDIKPLLKSR